MSDSKLLIFQIAFIIIVVRLISSQWNIERILLYDCNNFNNEISANVRSCTSVFGLDSPITDGSIDIYDKDIMCPLITWEKRCVVETMLTTSGYCGTVDLIYKVTYGHNGIFATCSVSLETPEYLYKLRSNDYSTIECNATRLNSCLYSYIEFWSYETQFKITKFGFSSVTDQEGFVNEPNMTDIICSNHPETQKCVQDTNCTSESPYFRNYWLGLDEAVYFMCSNVVAEETCPNLTMCFINIKQPYDHDWCRFYQSVMDCFSTSNCSKNSTLYWSQYFTILYHRKWTYDHPECFFIWPYDLELAESSTKPNATTSTFLPSYHASTTFKTTASMNTTAITATTTDIKNSTTQVTPSSNTSLIFILLIVVEVIVASSLVWLIIRLSKIIN